MEVRNSGLLQSVINSSFLDNPKPEAVRQRIPKFSKSRSLSLNRFQLLLKNDILKLS